MPEAAMRRCRPVLLQGAMPLVLALLALLALLAGCAGAPVPPTIWLRLPAQAPGLPISALASASTQSAAREVWQLMLPLPLPGHLDRDSLFMPQAASGAAGGALVRPLAGARWVEPLREALPRLLREDLTLLMRQAGGTALWQAPLPPGLVPTRQLRVEIAAFEIAVDGESLLTRARWTLADAAGGRAPTVHEASLTTRPARAGDAEAWALTHREAIATLAARIAATMAES